MGRSGPLICASSVIFLKLPKVNDRPMGENSPNLVTLASVKGSRARGSRRNIKATPSAPTRQSNFRFAAENSLKTFLH
jgi:hypothetical protein